MSVITNLLDTLSIKRGDLGAVKALLDLARPDLATQRDCLAAEIEQLEAKIKGKAKYVPETQAHTLVGRLLQLVWCPGRKDIDKNALADVLAKYGVSAEDSARLFVKKNGYWSIRNRGKGA